jgi:hypothetical protein
LGSKKVKVVAAYILMNEFHQKKSIYVHQNVVAEVIRMDPIFIVFIAKDGKTYPVQAEWIPRDHMQTLRHDIRKIKIKAVKRIKGYVR